MIVNFARILSTNLDLTFSAPGYDPQRLGSIGRLVNSYSEYAIINLGFFTVLQHYFKICYMLVYTAI